MKPAVLVVAGLDPSGGAGLLADAEAIVAAGGRPLCCASAITVQTTRAVRRFEALSPALVADQVRALAEEESVAAVKLGMLGSPAIADALAKLRPLLDVPWVIDPVLGSSSGAKFADPRDYDALLRGAWITPNVIEAGALAGKEPPGDGAEMEEAARELLARGARGVLLKGGHLRGAPLDLVLDERGATLLEGVRRPAAKRGTGCRLASHFAAGLAGGADPVAAAKAAKTWVASYLDRPVALRADSL